MPAGSIDAIVTDPPYALGFMGKEWDRIGDTGRGARVRTVRAAEVTPPGQGHTTSGGAYLAAGVDSLRSAGKPFQVWCEAWAREALRVLRPGGHLAAFGGTRTYHRLTCAVEDAGFEVRDCLSWLYGSGFPKSKNLDGEWQGWGTALKPAWEPAVLARKPLDGTVAANVLAHGTGALNIDGCRIGTDVTVTVRNGASGIHGRYGRDGRVFTRENPPGRWPANVVLDAEAATLVGEQSRFFYTAKASKSERGDGNTHPTVKPLALMRWIVRLVTPPGGIVLDPFAGSGTTALACREEGFSCILIEREQEYVDIIHKRLGQLRTEMI